MIDIPSGPGVLVTVLLKGEPMEEKLWESIQKAANVLHWLGKYDECNALVMTARLMRANNIETLEEWTQFSVPDPRGPHNDHFLETLGMGADRLVMAWGALSPQARRLFSQSIGLLRATCRGMLCLGKTRSGDPRHPSRLPYAVGFEPWDA